MDERRRFTRYDHRFEVEYSPKGDGTIYSQSVSKNISKGGICIPVLSRLVRIGDTIRVDIYIENKKTPITAMGKVAWTKETNEVAGTLLLDTEAGIEFIDADASNIDLVLKEAQ